MICLRLFTICFCWILSCVTTKAGQGNNNAAVNFHIPTTKVNKTSEILSAGDHFTDKWIWQPLGDKKNEVSSALILPWFKDDDSELGEDDSVYDEEVNETQKHENWTFIVTMEVNTTKISKTLDGRRNEYEEKLFLVHERHLRKTNWCFKETEDGKTNNKFKKAGMCCRRRKECRRRRHVKRGIHACLCDIYFHICLKHAKTKMAKSIEKMYFKRNIVCYKKEHKICTIENDDCGDPTYLWKTIPPHLK